MTYKEYIGLTKTYVVVYVTGLGIMEDNFIEHNVVFETDDECEANKKAQELTKQNNTIDEINSTWYRNRFHVNINTSTKKGKVLLNEFRNK